MGWCGPMREDHVGENWLATKKNFKKEGTFWRLSGCGKGINFWKGLYPKVFSKKLS